MITLAANSLDLWWMTVPELPRWRAEPCLSLLDDEELARAERATRPRHRQRFIVAHACLRIVLSRYLDADARQIAFDHVRCPQCSRSHGKPQLAGDTGVHFSMSHSRDGVLFGVSEAPVGVDLEGHPPRKGTAERLGRYLHVSEQRVLATLPQQGRDDAFLRFWLRKEAYLKAVGVGLAHGVTPNQIDVEGDRRWRAVNVSAPTGFRAAAVVQARATGLVSVQRRELRAPGGEEA